MEYFLYMLDCWVETLNIFPFDLYMQLKTFLKEAKDLFAINGQCHGWWYRCEARGQDISSHAIDLILTEYYGLSARSANISN